MDGLLVVDKPAGPTSHDVVARVRRALGERRIGHTGTLDPAATGVLPLVLGRATRLARFLSASDKSYEAVVCLGVSTDTCDAAGTASGPRYEGPMPSRETIDRALDEFRGTFLQQPPAYSAKKIDGQRSYRIARGESRALSESQLSFTGAGAPPPARTDADASPRIGMSSARHGRGRYPDPVTVTTSRVDLLSVAGDRVTLHVSCSAGFYVRALAHGLGERLGIGAHLLALRRTRSGDITLDQAVPLDAVEQDPERAIRAVLPVSRMLSGLSAVLLTVEGARRAAHGLDIRPADSEAAGTGRSPAFAEPFVRLMDPAGDLVAIGTPAGVSGFLHPAVVLV
jgi:tRNA pseudouridine55 synthase